MFLLLISELAGCAGLPAPQPQQLSFFEGVVSRERRLSDRGGIFEPVAETDPWPVTMHSFAKSADRVCDEVGVWECSS